jgi:hypothetical protein
LRSRFCRNFKKNNNETGSFPPRSARFGIHPLVSCRLSQTEEMPSPSLEQRVTELEKRLNALELIPAVAIGPKLNQGSQQAASSSPQPATGSRNQSGDTFSGREDQVIGHDAAPSSVGNVIKLRAHDWGWMAVQSSFAQKDAGRFWRN